MGAQIRCFTVIAALACAIEGAAARGQAPLPPQFRAGVEMARVDVTVLDDRTRKPIRGLTAEDFVIKIGGKIQPIAALAETEAAAQPTGTANVRTASGDVLTNAPVRGRLFVIVMDDANGAGNVFHRQEGPRIAHAVVDAMAPDDRAAVVFALFNRNAVGFTADRAALHRAIDTFDPRRNEMGLELSEKVLNRTREFLGTMPGYRRAVVWITLGIELRSDRLLRTLGVPVYTFHTRGLEAMARLSVGRPVNPIGDALRTLATDTGGWAYVDTNAVAAEVPKMFAELSSYYTIGFPSAGLKDGTWITLEMKPPHAEVVPAGFSYNAPSASKPASPPAAAATVAKRASAELFDALAGPLPSGDLSLALSASPVATSPTGAALVLTVGFTPPPHAVAGDAYSLQLLVFEGDGSKEVHRQSQTIHASRLGYGEVLLRVPVPPGRYYLRLSFGHEASRTTGSVYAPAVLIPDFKKAALSLSGVLIGRTESAPVGGRQAVADLLPFAPTAIRDFSRTDHVGALLRVHQPANARPVPTTIETTILDEQGTAVATNRQTLAATAFAAGAAEYRYEVPLAELRPGSFVMLIAATTGKLQDQRTVRFTVQPEKSDASSSSMQARR